MLVAYRLALTFWWVDIYSLPLSCLCLYLNILDQLTARVGRYRVCLSLTRPSTASAPPLWVSGIILSPVNLINFMCTCGFPFPCEPDDRALSLRTRLHLCPRRSRALPLARLDGWMGGWLACGLRGVFSRPSVFVVWSPIVCKYTHTLLDNDLNDPLIE